MKNKNLSIKQESSVTTARLYDTDIVTVGNGQVTLNRSTFKTATTKRVMNEVSEALGLGFHVYQKNYEWYVRNTNGNVQHFKNKTLKLK